MTTLFDLNACISRKLTTPAAARNAIGNVAEDFACAVLKLERKPIDGRKELCVDAETKKGLPVEIKSVGRSRSAILYKWRVEKEERILGRDYQYIFVLHNCPITVRDSQEIMRWFTDNPPLILITSLGVLLDHVCAKQEPRKFALHEKVYPSANGRIHGTQRAGYKEGGWQFTINRILKLCPPSKRAKVGQWANSTVRFKVQSTN